MKQVMAGWMKGGWNRGWMVDEWSRWRLDEVNGGCMKWVREGWNGGWLNGG